MILISACLIGEHVKYDGSHNFHKIARELYDTGRAIPVCPEVLGGMSTPRVPSEIVGEKVVSKTGIDVSSYFQKGAEKTLEIAKQNNIKIAVLQARSPSCGSSQIYDGTFQGNLIDGQGMTTRLLQKHGIKVMTIDEYIRDYYETDR